MYNILFISGFHSGSRCSCAASYMNTCTTNLLVVAAFEVSAILLFSTTPFAIAGEAVSLRVLYKHATCNRSLLPLMLTAYISVPLDVSIVGKMKHFRGGAQSQSLSALHRKLYSRFLGGHWPLPHCFCHLCICMCASVHTCKLYTDTVGA